MSERCRQCDGNNIQARWKGNEHMDHVEYSVASFHVNGLQTIHACTNGHKWSTGPKIPNDVARLIWFDHGKIPARLRALIDPKRVAA